jgi:hypothetical protein
MYVGADVGGSPPNSHLSAPPAYLPPDSAMSEGTYATRPGALPTLHAWFWRFAMRSQPPGTLALACASTRGRPSAMVSRPL